MTNVFETHPLPASAGPETRALDAGLVIDPATGAIAPNVSMSVNNVLMPGDGAFSADGVADLADLHLHLIALLVGAAQRLGAAPGNGGRFS